MPSTLTRRLLRNSWLGVALLATVSACGQPQAGSETQQPPAQPGDALILAAAHVVVPPAGTSPADLPDTAAEGAHLLVKYCTTCHSLPSPATHSVTDWPRVLRQMWLMTDGVAAQHQVPVPTPTERVVLLQYLLDHALKVSSAGLPAAPGRDLFTRECSRCHELPDPKQHSPEDWAAVVIRMRQHMVQMLGRSPSQDQVQSIILYLEQASRAGA